MREATVTPEREWDSPWQVTLTPKLKAHWRWYDRGRAGEGRIEMADESLQGANIRGLQGAKFARCDFSGAALNLMSDVELTDCIFDEARLMMSNWNRAKLTDCRVHGAWMNYAHFDAAYIHGGDWLGTHLAHTVWTGATVQRLMLRSTIITDSRFDGAVFANCDFRFANLGRYELGTDAARCTGTRFTRCDFRGTNLDRLRLNHTVFDHCLFSGMTGKPDLEGSCELIEPDFSAAGDGGANTPTIPGIRDPKEVLRVWREADPDRINFWSLNGDSVEYEPGRHYPERMFIASEGSS